MAAIGRNMLFSIIYNMHKPCVGAYIYIYLIARKLSKPDDGRYRPKHVVFYYI